MSSTVTESDWEDAPAPTLKRTPAAAPARHPEPLPDDADEKPPPATDFWSILTKVLVITPLLAGLMLMFFEAGLHAMHQWRLAAVGGACWAFSLALVYCVMPRENRYRQAVRTFAAFVATGTWVPMFALLVAGNFLVLTGIAAGLAYQHGDADMQRKAVVMGAVTVAAAYVGDARGSLRKCAANLR